MARTGRMEKKRRNVKKSDKIYRYCGKCGKGLSKKEINCPNCNIEWNEFEKPYNKIPLKIKIFLCMFYFPTMGYLLVLLFALPDESPEVCYLYTVFIIALSLSIYLTFKAIDAVRNGLLICRNCNEKTSLNAKHCVYCGSLLKWV